MACSLGDKEKPRAWSKYAKDSSRNPEAIKAKEEAKEKQKESQDKSQSSGGNEELKSLEEDPEFAEFLKIHDVKANRGATWGNDGDGGAALTTVKAKKTTKGSGAEDGTVSEIGMEENDADNEKNDSGTKKKKKKKKKEKSIESFKKPTETDAKVGEESKSDLDFLRSKKATSGVFSDDESDDDEGAGTGQDKNEVKEEEEGSTSVKGEDSTANELMEEEEDEGEEGEEEEGGEEETKQPKEVKERYFVKMRGLPFNAKDKQIREFFHPITVTLM